MNPNDDLKTVLRVAVHHPLHEAIDFASAWDVRTAVFQNIRVVIDSVLTSSLGNDIDSEIKTAIKNYASK